MADLDANLSEMLNGSDPEALQKLLALRDQLNATPSTLPTQATPDPSAPVAQAEDYGQLFGKQTAQDLVDAQSIPGKSAADSAQILAQANPAEAAEANMTGAAAEAAPETGAAADVAGSAAGDAVAGGASKALGPIGALLGLYGGEAGAAGLDDTPGAKSSNEPDAVPYGGMSDKQLADYIKYKDTGPQATTGFNPNAVVGPNIPADMLRTRLAPVQTDTTDDSDDNNTPTVGRIRSNPPTTSTTSSQGNSGQGQSQQDALGALMAKLGIGDNAKLAAAQRQQSLGASLGISAGIGEKLAAALSRGNYKPDYTVANEITAQGGIPVQQFKDQQAANKESVDTGVKLSDLLDKQQLQSADSNVSQAYRNMASTLNPQLAKSPNFNSMTAEQIKNAQPMVDSAMRMQYLQLARQQGNQNRQDRMQQMQDQKDDASEMKLAQGLSQMQSPRGAAGMSAQTTQLADRALQLANNYTPDKNDLTKQQVQALYNDASRVMTGGVATQHGVETLFPDTYKSSLDNLMQKISNTPTGADMGPFVDQISKQMQMMKDEATDFRKARASEYLAGYNDSLGKRRPEAFDRYKNMFGVTNKDLNPAAPTKAPVPGSHPQDSDMINWAKQNQSSQDPATRQAAMKVIQANLQTGTTQ